MPKRYEPVNRAPSAEDAERLSLMLRGHEYISVGDRDMLRCVCDAFARLKRSDNSGYDEPDRDAGTASGQ